MLNLIKFEDKIELSRREAMVMFEHIIYEIVPPVAGGVADVPTLREGVVDIRQGLNKLDGKVTALLFMYKTIMKPELLL